MTMTMSRLVQSMLAILGVAGCVSHLPLENSPCPCPAGFTCCLATNRCVRPEVMACEDGAGGSGMGGAAGGMGGAAGEGAGGMGGAAGSGGAPPPVVVSPFVSVGIGTAHACAVRQDGTIKCVGSNDKGQATPPPGTFYQVVAGAQHTCAQKQDLNDKTKDRLWVCWGDNTYGQATPPPVQLDEVVAGDHHTCGRFADSIMCWGDDTLGQATPPVALTGTTELAAGRNHTCAIVGYPSMSHVVCWGDNSRGQSTPPTLYGPFFLSAGGDHTCASGLGDNSLECWGDNDHGQSTSPPGNIRSLSVASGHSCGVLFSNPPAIRCWGTDWGTSTPMPPAGGFYQVFAGDFLNCVLPEDKTTPMLCWGQTYEPWY